MAEREREAGGSWHGIAAASSETESFATVQRLKRVVKTASKAAEPKPLFAVLLKANLH